ncbi:hypothetical protein Ppb6_02216 [Photorhabdus australis subsp. thailandensis]|uniref:Uncharacterized protein n=1 Tax=Photorhabdus australis subsp. thailandensis TaxID=2805096 RepID=A0A1C0U3G8_9GAMM|nr:YwqJ-related putative deaminase [Photorhabdus australis]OCQ52480.1 hypothetical protein Ppb6_02216 [Photorhabdus australis subsp. thailandensis]
MFKYDTSEKMAKFGKGKTSDGMLLDTLYLEIPDEKAVMSAYKSQILDELRNFSEKTHSFFSGKKPLYSKKYLANLAAHAGYVHVTDYNSIGNYKDGFVNFKDNSRNLAEGKLFPGIRLIKRPKLSIVRDKETERWKKQESDEADAYEITDIESFISGVRDMYSRANVDLHPVIESLIRNHIVNNDHVLPTMAGIAGLHAEVQALNNLLILADGRAGKIVGGRKIEEYMQDMLKSFIFTQRLTTKQAGNDFAACHNCSGILSVPANVITGKVASAGSNFSLILSRYKNSQESPI